MRALEQVDAWPVRTVAAGIARASGVVAARGDESEAFRWASVTKIATAIGALVALEEGVVDLDEPAGPPGSTVRHLFAHASGLPMNEGPPIAPPGRRRIYSNSGFEALAGHVEQAAAMPFADYLRGALIEPLKLEAELPGSPAWAMRGRLADLLAIARELLAPTLLAGETLAEATTVVFPGLTGVVPGFGRYEPNDWGLGFELRDGKSPHWTGTRNSPRTFGHFGASGTFLWIDPERDLALAVLTDREFGEWAREAWPRLADDVLAEAA